jgi:hypothetical protein
MLSNAEYMDGFESERMWKKVVVASFKILCQDLSQSDEEQHNISYSSYSISG